MNLKKLRTTILVYISKINILGSPPQFNVGGKTTPPSWTGILLSLAFIAVILFLGFIFAKNALDTTSPEIKIESIESSIYPEVDLFKHKFFLALLPSVPSTVITNFNAMFRIVAIISTKN